MDVFRANGIALRYQIEGPADGPPVVFANSLGTDMRLWDQVLRLLPPGLRILRYDKRGHGGSDCPDAPYSMGALVGDVEGIMDHVGMTDAVFIGLSIGGMIAQGLAVKRPDLIRAMVLSNTAAKIATKQIWQDRIDNIRANGLASITDAIMARWFSKKFLATGDADVWRDLLLSTPAEGYIGCAHAISGTDFITPTSGLRLPTLGIAGSEDGSTPPDLVRETTDLIPGSQFHLIRGSGHLPCADNPTEYAQVLTGFLQATGHI